MEPAELYRRIAAIDDEQAQRALQVILKGFAVRHDCEDLFASPEQLEQVIHRYQDLILAHKQKEFSKPSSSSAEPTTKPPPGPMRPSTEPLKATDPTKRAIGAREVLLAIADDTDLRPSLESWFTSSRPTLFDPITSALILAGIVFILSVDIKFKIKKDKDDKMEWELELKKDPTKESILSKFFGLFR